MTAANVMACDSWKKYRLSQAISALCGSYGGVILEGHQGGGQAPV